MSPLPRTPLLATDGFVRDAEGRVLLIRRKNPPKAGSWALPGGFVDVDEDPREACVRELREETGLEVAVERLGGVWGSPGRDPRFHTVTVVYVCSVVRGTATGADDADEARWFTPEQIGALDFAFDHRDVVAALLAEPRTGPAG